MFGREKEIKGLIYEFGRWQQTRDPTLKFSAVQKVGFLHSLYTLVRFTRPKATVSKCGAKSNATIKVNLCGCGEGFRTGRELGKDLTLRGNTSKQGT